MAHHSSWILGSESDDAAECLLYRSINIPSCDHMNDSEDDAMAKHPSPLEGIYHSGELKEATVKIL